MQLYDGESSIYWAHKGLMTKEEMQKVPQMEQLLSQPSVLFDDGMGKIYDWLLLSVMCGKYGVEYTGDSDTDYPALVEAMAEPLKTPEQEIQAQLDALAGIGGDGK